MANLQFLPTKPLARIFGGSSDGTDPFAIKAKFEELGFFIYEISNIQDLPTLLGPGCPNVDDYANLAFEWFDENSLDLADHMCDQLALPEFNSFQVKEGIITKNENVCGTPDFFDHYLNELNSSDIGMWAHIWRGNSSSGTGLLFFKAKNTIGDLRPSGEEERLLLEEYITALDEDNLELGDFSSEGELIMAHFQNSLILSFNKYLSDEAEEAIAFDFFQSTNDNPDIMTMTQFITELKAVENDFPFSEKDNTKLMISKLRKIFYNGFGWDNYLIPDASGVPSPYPTYEKITEEIVMPFPYPTYPFYPPFVYKIIKKPTFPCETPSGMDCLAEPVIFRNHNQEVLLDFGPYAGYIVDVGHLLAGLDSYNNNGSVGFFGFATGLQANRNIDANTWLGDISSVLFRWYVEYRRSFYSEVNPSLAQEKLDFGADGGDMLGNMDAFTIARNYSQLVQAETGGPLVSDILANYYLGTQDGADFQENGVELYQSNRFSMFAQEDPQDPDNNASLGSSISTFFPIFIDRDALVEKYYDQIADVAGFILIKDADKRSVAIYDLLMLHTNNKDSKVLMHKFLDALQEAIRLE